MLLAGIILLQMTHNLARRKEAAWYVTVITLSITLVTHITRDLDLHHSVVAGLLRLSLDLSAPFLCAQRSGIAAVEHPDDPLLLGTVFVYGYVGLSYMEEQYRWREVRLRSPRHLIPAF
jgi:lysylphosphatidylglycerol synthetase-like protein (DUF2156 family)